MPGKNAFCLVNQLFELQVELKNKEEVHIVFPLAAPAQSISFHRAQVLDEGKSGFPFVPGDRVLDFKRKMKESDLRLLNECGILISRSSKCLVPAYFPSQIPI